MVNKKSQIIVVLAMSLLVFNGCGHRGPYLDSEFLLPNPQQGQGAQSQLAHQNAHLLSDTL